MWKIVAASVISIATLALIAFVLSGNSSRKIEHPNFEIGNRLFIVSGVAEIGEILLDTLPLKETNTLLLDIDLYLYSICTDGKDLFVSGVKTDSDSELANGVYRVYSKNGETELLYDSENNAVVKTFCINDSGQLLVVAVQQDEIVLINQVSKEIVRRISYDFHAGFWSLVGGRHIVGFSDTNSTLYTMNITSDHGFNVISDVSNILSVHEDSFSFKRSGVWYEYRKNIIQQVLGEDWVAKNAKYAKMWPPRAVKDANGNMIQLFENEIKGKTYFMYNGREIGSLRGSVYDMCVY